MSLNKFNYLAISILVVVGFALYVNSFQNQMFWDDYDSILNNQYVQDWRYLPNYFSENLIAGAGFTSNYWRPMLLLVFSLEWHLWQDWTPGYHFVNTSFHIVNAILLFLILFYVFKKRWLAILTALIFLAHPLQTEAVTYVAGLGDSLSIFFIFLGLLFYLKFRISKKIFSKNGFYFLSLVMYIFALMTKETAIIMPALIFITGFFAVPIESDNLKKRLKDIGKTIWPFLVIAGFYVLLRATLLNFGDTFNLYGEENVFTENFHIRLFTFFRVLTIYFQLLFWPFNLHMERSVEIADSFSSFSVIFGGFVSLGLLALAFSQFKRFPIASFGILWFFIGLAPTSNLLIPVSGLLYEHWLYLPLVGIFLVLIWLGELLGKRYGLQRILLGIFVIFLIFLSILTINRNKDWRDPITFYNQTLQHAPNSYRVINNLGMAYADIGDQKMAEETYLRAISLDPQNPVAYHNLGNTYRETNRTDLAIENFKTAISIDPGFVFSYNSLASFYLENKDYQKAKEVWEDYLDYTDEKIDVLFLLAQIAFEEEDFKSTLNYLEEVLKIEPENRFIREAMFEIKNLMELPE